MVLKVIFLDIDGVLLPFPSKKEEHNNDDDSLLFPEPPVKALKYLLEHTGDDDDTAKLVLSSTWRVRSDFVQDIVDCLQRYGIQNMEEGFLDITDPNMHSERQWEIAKWLADHHQQNGNNNNNKIVWLALDDEDLLDGDANRKHRLLFEGHVVHTKSDIGLTMEDARKGVELWNQQLMGKS